MGSIDVDTIPPPGAWDSHVHIVDEDHFGIEHGCLIAFSVYHTDYSSTLDALSRLGKGRAVACIDPNTISNEELQQR
ncbi:hypothetical protein RU639_005830 [Aspergillus parasiticus]